MDKSAKIEYNGKSYDFPIITGSENEEAIDINKLRAETGLITYDPGYKNTGHCISNITYLDGENGILRYRGYSVDELCEKKSFLDVVYLLIFGDLPSSDQLSKFQNDIREEALVDEDLKNFKEIYDWLEGLGYPDNFQQRANLQSALQQNNANTGTVYSDGSLIVTTAQYQPNISINFIDLYPVSLGGLEFNTQGTDVEYLQGSVSFAYRKYSIDILK